MRSNENTQIGRERAAAGAPSGPPAAGDLARDADRRDATSPPAFDRILVGVDGDRVSEWAVQAAVRLATTTGAAVALLNVVDLSNGLSPELAFMDENTYVERRAAADHLMDHLQRTYFAGWRPVRLVRPGDPASEIVAAADEWGADLIVVGTHAHGAIARFLLGSTAEAVVRRAHCPVLTVGHDPAGRTGHATAATPAAAAAGSAR